MDKEARLQALESGLKRLADREAIWDLMARYARALDEEDDEDLAAIYAPDATLETVPWSNGKVFSGRESIVRVFNGYQQRFVNRKRFITNERIVLDDAASATGWSNWLVLHSNAGESYVGWGSYDWKFSRVDGAWLISAMVIHVDCMTTLDNGWGNVETLLTRFPEKRSQ